MLRLIMPGALTAALGCASTPIAPNDTEFGRQKDRRVEIVLEKRAASIS